MAAPLHPLNQESNDRRFGWARPGSAHDRSVRWAMVILPSGIGALAAVLIVAPLLTRSEISFVLAKDKVEQAPERMRVAEARYRGEDDKGRPFSIAAGSAVQQSSAVPVVAMTNLAGQMTLDDGIAQLKAPTARYDLDREHVDVNGPLSFASADGYRLETSNVGVDMKSRSMVSSSPVTGQTRLGTFTAQRMRANLDARTVTLDGQARLHIVQGGMKRR
jgi:lipopolysaccharide export system protein LptC